MSVSVKVLDGLKRRVIIHIAAESIEQAYQKKIKEVAHKTKLPGFRAGKVPVPLVEKRHGEAILHDAANELMQPIIKETLESHALQLAGKLTIETATVKRGQAAEFQLGFEVFPTIPAPSIEGQILTECTVTVSEEDTSKQLIILQKEYAHVTSVARGAKLGDRVRIDFEGRIKGEAIGPPTENYMVDLGSRTTVPGFEEGLLGATVDEMRHITVSFPGDYHNPDLQNKEVTFQVTIRDVLEVEPASFETLAKKFNIPNEEKEIRQHILTQIQKRADELVKVDLKRQAIEALKRQNDIDVPESLIKEEATHLRKMQGTASDAPSNEAALAPYWASAKERVLVGLLLREVIKKNNIRLDEDKLKKRIEAIAGQYEKAQEIISWYYNNRKHVAHLEAMILEEQAIEQLLGQATIEHQTISYEEMQKRSAS